MPQFWLGKNWHLIKQGMLQTDEHFVAGLEWKLTYGGGSKRYYFSRWHAPCMKFSSHLYFLATFGAMKYKGEITKFVLNYHRRKLNFITELQKTAVLILKLSHLAQFSL